MQSGWLRANERELDASTSMPLEPVLSLRAADVAALPNDRFVPITIPLYYQGHVYRAGSRLHVTISAPNGDQPIWSFGETDPPGQATVAIARSRRMPSRLLLPAVSGVNAPAGLPPCPGQRGEPCRGYVSYANTAAAR